MRVLQQITFEAKDDAEAMRIAGERLGREAVVLSTRPVKTGGVLGFFRKTVLPLAGVLFAHMRGNLYGLLPLDICMDFGFVEQEAQLLFYFGSRFFGGSAKHPFL